MLTRQDKQWIEDKIEVVRNEVRSDLLNFKDTILSEIKAMREEMSALLYRQNEHTEQLGSHEHRIIALEARTAAS